MKKNPVVILSGPTASFKTHTALFLAEQLAKEAGVSVEIVNFDSLLFYRELNIGTAKPTPEELRAIKHHMIDIASAQQPINAADYADSARKILAELHTAGKIPILAGGSGFYLRALIKGMYDEAHVPPDVREKVETLYQNQGMAPIVDVLKVHDPESLHVLHPNDHYRLKRAVEYFWTTGDPISKAKAEMDLLSPYDFSQTTIPDWQILHCHLDLPKPEHLAVIRERTQAMLANGLVDEVKKLLESGFTGKEKPLNSIGYKEIMDYLAGEYPNLSECAERIIISTRQLAKAQRTWFKKVGPKSIFHPKTEAREIYATVKTFLDLQG